MQFSLVFSSTKRARFLLLTLRQRGISLSAWCRTSGLLWSCSASEYHHDSALCIPQSPISMPRFFVSATQINQSHAALTGSEFHHLRHVLRLDVGDSLTLYDEHGREHQGTIISLSSTSAEV